MLSNINIQYIIQIINNSLWYKIMVYILSTRDIFAFVEISFRWTPDDESKI